MSPDICGIGSTVDRYVADYLDTLLLCILMKLIPLLIEKILYKGVEIYLILMTGFEFFNCCFFVISQLFRPYIPACTEVAVLYRHENAVLYGLRSQLLIDLIDLSSLLPVVIKSKLQGFEFTYIDFAVIHLEGAVFFLVLISTLVQGGQQIPCLLVALPGFFLPESFKKRHGFAVTEVELLRILQIFFSEKTFLYKSLQIHKVRISCEC